MVTVVTVVVADQVSQFGDQMRRAKPLMNTGPSQVEGQYCLSTAEKKWRNKVKLIRFCDI